MLRLIFLLLVPLGVWGQEVSLLTSAQIDWLNKSYQDQHYVTNNWLSFPVPEGSWSIEVRQETPQGHIVGAGFAQTGIAGGQFQNGSVTVVQPSAVLSFPYVFVGQDWQWIDLELGLGWSREDSYTTPAFLLRLLPESGFHLKFRLGREDFISSDTALTSNQRLGVGGLSVLWAWNWKKTSP